MSTEILAPAGSFEQLRAAVCCGADAVYMGASDFNARQGAQNFTPEELREAVEYCHLHKVKTHLALNTLIYDSELSDAVKLAEYACKIGMDAIIVQDMGLASLIRRACPDMPLHGSTQLSVHTMSGVQFLTDAGFSRAILSRELSRAEISKIATQSEIELEIFVHGAYCMSVSGQCYMSSMFGGRSGNRGLCAQPCRLHSLAPDKTEYALSLKDMSLIEHLNEISSMGITSVKIEGRLKRPEYVAAAVTACRQKLYGDYEEENTVEKLRKVFSRSGFTDGYYKGEISRDMFGIRTKDDVVGATGDLLRELSHLYEKDMPIYKVGFDLSIKRGQKARLTATSEKRTVFAEADEPVEAANKPLDEERCIAQLKKTGGTVFYPGKINVDLDDGLLLPIAQINSMRRSVLEQLKDILSAPQEKQFEMPDIPQGNICKTENPQLWAVFGNANSVPDNLSPFSYIFVPAQTEHISLLRMSEKLKNTGTTLGVTLPRGIFGMDEYYSRLLRRIKQAGINDCMVGNVGAMQLCLDEKMTVHGGIGMNITNAAALEDYNFGGLSSALVSFELSAKSINRLCGEMPTGAVIYGHMPLMLTRTCPAYGKCINCKGSYLVDRKGMKMPIVCKGGCSEILNPVPIYMGDRRSELKTDYHLLYFTTEDKDGVNEIVSKVLEEKSFGSDITRGLYYKGAE